MHAVALTFIYLNNTSPRWSGVTCGVVWCGVCLSVVMVWFGLVRVCYNRQDRLSWVCRLFVYYSSALSVVYTTPLLALLPNPPTIFALHAGHHKLVLLTDQPFRHG